jgi:hypothetical protein
VTARFLVIFLQIGGQSLVSAAVVDSHALPRLDPVDEELLGDQCVHACNHFDATCLYNFLTPLNSVAKKLISLHALKSRLFSLLIKCRLILGTPGL